MTGKGCLEKNCIGKPIRGYTISTSVFCAILTITVLCIVHPWNLVELEVFIITQVAAVFIITVMKLTFLWVMCCDLNERLILSLVLILSCIFVNATICGFLHPDVTFETQMVEVPVSDDNHQ